MRTAFNGTLLSPPSLDILTERLYATGYESLEREDLEIAERCFALMAVSAPRDERAWIGMGVSRERRADWAGAAARYALGTAAVPSSVWCHLGHGRALRELGRHREADAAFDEAELHATDPALMQLIERERFLS